MNKKISLMAINKLLNEEIKHLEGHILIANKGIKIDVERTNSWIFQTKHLKKKINRIMDKK